MVLIREEVYSFDMWFISFISGLLYNFKENGINMRPCYNFRCDKTKEKIISGIMSVEQITSSGSLYLYI